MKNEPLDARDQALLLSRQHERNRLSSIHLSPLVGDVIHLLDGTIRRVAMVHYATKHNRATLQPSSATIGSPSLYWHAGGYMDYSGALDPGIDVSRFVRTGTVYANAWFFHHEQPRAHNGVEVNAIVTEWAEQP